MKKMRSMTYMRTRALRLSALAIAAAASLVGAGCATMGGAGEEAEPTLVDPPPVTSIDMDEQPETQTAAGEESKQQEGEVPLEVAESEQEEEAPPPEVVVQGSRNRHEAIRDLVVEAQTLLREVDLQYVLTGKGRKRLLRGRPVAFALWSEAKQEWTVAHIELPRPPIKWRPGRRPLAFKTVTPGIQARHVKGTGAERLMFAFSNDGDPLKVFGRKFPVFDNNLVKRRQWSAVVQTAKPIVYLPFTEDTFDPGFVSGGKEYLVATAQKAIEDLRAARAPSAAFPGELLADSIPLQVITTLAVIEQTDDADYVNKQSVAFDEVLSQYGLKQEEAYRYSVSSAKALGPMQFTNRRGNGTYAAVVRRCPEARLDPNFERGATNLLNAMKAAICLLDLELSQMRADIRLAYRSNPAVLGIFPVAAYNGGPRNVTKLYRVLSRMKVGLGELSRPGEQLEDDPVRCPCVWKADGESVRPVTIPRYNNENRWYIEKYQVIVSLFE
jgi:predicted small secreted protein